MTTLSEFVPSGSLDMRVEDFLDDRLQSAADLDSLDDLVASVETQRNQLQSQLDDAVRQLEDARRTAQDRHLYLRERIDDFNKLQESIDVRAKLAAASDAPSAAIARLQGPMRRLETVELARRYMLLLHDVECLRARARAHLPASPKAALEPYGRLRELALRLGALPGSDELHLVAHVVAVADALWRDMKTTMTAELRDVLAARRWPRVDPQSQMDDEWIACVEKLLDLQMPELVHSPGRLVSLLPFDVMVAILATEFRFHFLSDKPTSALHALGSHCFPWFLSTIEKWEDFFRDNLGHLLSDKFRDGPASRMAYLDPVCALVTALLPVMRDKVRAAAAEAAREPAHLSAFLSQLMALDNDIRTRFNYDGGDPEHGWPGLAADVLRDHFDAWFRVERQFAVDRFEKIMDSQEARKIDYDFAVAGKMKPTFAAVRVLDLLRAVTAKYERLRKLKHKTRFLTDIQLDILDAYHDRLRGSLEAYQSITSTLGRTLHGATREQLAALEGTGALETLCKVIGSADRVASTLSEWSDEQFFASLWEELQAHDARRTSQGIGVLDAVQGRVPDTSATGGDDSGIFDETVAAYTMRRKAAEELLIGALADSHSKAFRSYLHQVQWTTIGEAAVLDDPSQLCITPELDEPLRVLRRNLDFLSRALSAASLRRVWYEALYRLQDTLWNGVLVRQSFTALGAAQFAHDAGALLALVDRYLPAGSSALEPLRQGLRLLNLPSSSSAPAAGAGPTTMTLKEAADRAFASNEEARRLLEELGLEALTPTNARQILERRVENSESIGW